MQRRQIHASFSLFLIQTDVAAAQQFEECSPSTEVIFQTLTVVSGGKISACVCVCVSIFYHESGKQVNRERSILRLHTNPASSVVDDRPTSTFAIIATSAVTF